MREWVDRWAAGDERVGGDQRKENTKRDYRWTIARAQDTFGDAYLSDLTGGDVERFLHALTAAGKERGRTPSATTLAKHLRYLHACLEEAVPRYLPRTLLRRCRSRANRAGEATSGTTSPTTSSYGCGRRSRNERTRSALTDDAARILRGWFEIQGVKGRDALVFPNLAGGHIAPETILRRKLYPAMQAARTAEGKKPRKTEWGIPREGERGNPRVFHSFRHTFARLVLEHGGSREWLNKQLGHSSFAMTDRYSEWSDRRLAREAEGLSLGSV